VIADLVREKSDLGIEMHWASMNNEGHPLWLLRVFGFGETCS